MADYEYPQYIYPNQQLPVGPQVGAGAGFQLQLGDFRLGAGFGMGGGFFYRPPAPLAPSIPPAFGASQGGFGMPQARPAERVEVTSPTGTGRTFVQDKVDLNNRATVFNMQ